MAKLRAKECFKLLASGTRLVCSAPTHAEQVLTCWTTFEKLGVKCSAFSTTARAYTESKIFKCCIVGAGPAGFYTAEKLLKAHPNAVVDIVERLPSPFGLVRTGVAPDHPETKAVTNQFTRVVSGDRCNYWGNVTLGRDVSLQELRERYHSVVLAYGAESDRKLQVPGEEAAGVLSAREFVWWYNGHPEYRNLGVDLTNVDTAIVLGQGNVALDCARILTRDVGELSGTDIAEHAMEALRKSRLRRVLLVGRRGPAQLACTAKETRELLNLRGVRVNVNPQDLQISEADKVELEMSRGHRRVLELLTRAEAMQKEAEKKEEEEAATAGAAHSRGTSAHPAAALVAGTASPSGSGSESESGCSSVGGRSIDFVFFRKPVEFVTEAAAAAVGGCPTVQGLKFEKTRLEGRGSGGGGGGRGGGGAQYAVGTGEYEEVPGQLVLRSIGYKSIPVPGLPFDEARGVVPNLFGRVVCPVTGEVESGLYVVGWLKRGPTGIIGTNLVCAEETVAVLLEDHAKLLASGEPKEGGQGLHFLLTSRGVRVVGFEGWKRINEEEIRRGATKGKVREKIVNVNEMLEVALA